MTNKLTTNARLSDAELLDEIKRLATHERQATARLIAALGELDARRLYLGEGCSSLFTYCTHVLHLSEHAAYLRIEAARVTELRKRRHGAVDRPRETSVGSARRHVPASVKRAVWQRDQGQCAFVGTVGRCTERGFLEYHHRVPYADGGVTSTENLELRCRAHNAYEAQLWCGAREEDVVRESRATW